MATAIGRADSQQLVQNVVEIVKAIKAGSKTLASVQSNQLREIANLKKMHKTANNLRRLDYIMMEYELLDSLNEEFGI